MPCAGEGLADQSGQGWADDEFGRHPNENDGYALADIVQRDKVHDRGNGQGKEPADGDAQKHAGGEQHEIFGCEGHGDVGCDQQRAESEVDQLAIEAADDKCHGWGGDAEKSREREVFIKRDGVW